MEEITFSGPVFDGRADVTTKKMTHAIEDQIAQKALDKARELQLSSIRVEVTGAEPASLHIESSSFGKIVTDLHALKYGPWLEGTGSKNDIMRFRGYHSLEKATAEVNAEAEEDANRIAEPYIEEMR